MQIFEEKIVVNDLVVEREQLSLNMQPHNQSQKVVEQPQLEKQRGDRVEDYIEEETSRKGKFRARWAEGVHATIPPSVRWGDV